MRRYKDIWFANYERAVNEYEDAHPTASWDEINAAVTPKVDQESRDQAAEIIDAARMQAKEPK